VCSFFVEEFIHGDTTVTHDLLNKFNLSFIPVVRYGNLFWSTPGCPSVHVSQLPSESKNVILRLREDYNSLLEYHGEDISLGEYFRRKGYNEKEVAMADVLFSQTCNCDIDNLSVHDLQRELLVDTAGHGESRVREGYGKLLENLSRGLSIQLNQIVEEIHFQSEGVIVKTQSHEFKAKRIIVTLPIGVLRAGKVRFFPDLPIEVKSSINSFEMEPATKLLFKFDKRLWNESLTYSCHLGKTPRWWTSSFGRTEAKDSVIACFVNASRAAWIDAVDEREACRTALGELAVMLGRSVEELEAHLLAFQRKSWAKEEFTRGGYAHPAVGQSQSRQTLSQPVRNVLFFAGEHTAYHSNPQTVHGAFETGIRAAKQVRASLQMSKM
jgi:monoamine oxidase